MNATTKERPILFSGPMVRAILDGRKTQTRRALKPQPDGINVRGDDLLTGRFGAIWTTPDRTLTSLLPCPYGQLGDRLWVRETWAKPEPGVMSRDHDGSPIFAADYPNSCKTGFGPWKPSMFMPRQASRLSLEITGIRVERLQEMSPLAARAEGFNCIYGPDPACHFVACWVMINGPGSWDANPWVWVVSFQRI